jgi:hypothetical protein
MLSTPGQRAPKARMWAMGERVRGDGPACQVAKSLGRGAQQSAVSPRDMR